MGSMIERMHNVSQRDTTQPRKRKSEVQGEDDKGFDRKKAKSTYQGAANGGTISQHMKAERERYAAQESPSAAPIDLTGDDNAEEEVVFVKENVNEEVCYGVLRGKAHISRFPAVSQKQISALGNDYWPRAKLEVRREASQDHKIELMDREGRLCGNLDLKLGSALAPLLDGRQQNKIRLSVSLDTHKKAKHQYVGQHVSEYLPVSVVLYGPRKNNRMVGLWLSQKQMFLSAPQTAGMNIGKEVVNPHVPTAYGSGAAGQRRPQTTQPISSVTRTQEEMRRDASSMFDGLVKHEDLPEKEPSSGIIITSLLSHQKQGLHFMTDHEKAEDDSSNPDSSGFSLWKPQVDKKGRQTWYNVITSQEVAKKPDPVQGGILADMMGLGKTLSILSLIAETKGEARTFAAQNAPGDLMVNAKATLIVCPKSVMSNWSEQIRAHVKPNALSVYTYHGSNRTDDVEELRQYNVILTTYNTAAAEFTVKGRPLASVNWFRIVLDEAHQIRNQNTQVAKGCCQLAAQRRWAVTGTPVQNGLGDLGALIKFLRIKPFDEGQNWAHYILAPFKSANTDVVTHLRLLVDSITLRRMKDKIDLRGRSENCVRLKFPPADQKIYSKLSGESGKQLTLLSGGSQGGALKGKAYAHVLKSIGRLRAFCAHGLDMFSEEDRKEISEGMNPDNAIAIDLGDEPSLEEYAFVTEKQAYETLHIMSDSDADRCEKCNRKIGEKKSEVDEEGALVVADDDDEESSSEEEEEEGDDTLGYLNPCYHLICPKCKDSYVEQSQTSMTADFRHKCPCCEAYIRFGLYDYHRATLRDFVEARTATVKVKRSGKGRKWDESTYNGPSAKVKALVDDLHRTAREEYVPEGEPPIRSVVFSGWTTYLDLIELALDDQHIGYVRLDGTMSVRQRSAVLERFRTDDTITVLLVSIKAGGQGLNFTAANHVYMMEPQFNPGVEQQAIDRVHRLGQKRDVEIVHYIMEESVEEGILRLQRRKEDLARFTLERKMSRVEEAKKRIEDLRDLFK